MKTLFAWTIAWMSLCAAAQAVETHHSVALEISHGWTRATPPGSDMAVGYVTIINKGKGDDTLVGATSDAAGSVSLHQTVAEKDGVMAMQRAKDGIAVPAGKTVVLGPGGYHMMWMGLHQPLKAGESVSGTLVFEHAGALPVVFKVMPAGATEAP